MKSFPENTYWIDAGCARPSARVVPYRHVFSGTQVMHVHAECSTQGIPAQAFSRFNFPFSIFHIAVSGQR